jgi:hypothetical protein
MALQIDDSTILILLSALLFILNIVVVLIVFLMAKRNSRKIMKKLIFFEENTVKKITSLEQKSAEIEKAELALEENVLELCEKINSLELKEKPRTEREIVVHSQKAKDRQK